MIYHIYETTDRRWQEGVQEAIVAVVEAFEAFQNATNLRNQITATFDLQEAISDLKGWHTRYDADNEEIVPELEHATGAERYFAQRLKNPKYRRAYQDARAESTTT